MLFGSEAKPSQIRQRQPAGSPAPQAWRSASFRRSGSPSSMKAAQGNRPMPTQQVLYETVAVFEQSDMPPGTSLPPWVDRATTHCAPSCRLHVPASQNVPAVVPPRNSIAQQRPTHWWPQSESESTNSLFHRNSFSNYNCKYIDLFAQKSIVGVTFCALFYRGDKRKIGFLWIQKLPFSHQKRLLLLDKRSSKYI